MKKIWIMAMLSSIAINVFAEPAPVFDADSAPQSDSQTEGPLSAQPRATAYAPVQTLTLEQRVARAEQQMNNIQRSDAVAKLNDLQKEIQSLRGQLDEVTHQLQTVQTQQKTMYGDLDKRINKLSQDAKPAAAPVTTSNTSALPKIVPVPLPGTPTLAKSNSNSAAAQPNVAEEQQTYQIAYDLIKAKKYNEAVVALQKMLQKYPSGQFAANAHYWLGELYGLMGKNEESATEFETVVKNYADSPKISDAQLKVGLIYAAQFKWSEAKGAFKKVVNHYPGSASARLAAEQLKQLKLAGH